MSYDRADWHYGGNFPAGLPQENGGTHIGMFLAWAILNGLVGQEHHEDFPEALAAVRARTMTGREFLFKNCDGKFWEVDLNEEGNAFARAYYKKAPGQRFDYLTDYADIFGDGAPTLYHVSDTWENYDRIAELLTRRLEKWRASRPA
jgi:hypothetical protein